ncbi:MAG: hypothetical protein ABII22_03070 [Candidatus Micrarchaeota archaeon]
MDVLGFLNDVFIALRDVCGTVCVIGIVLFIVLWLIGGRNAKYSYWQNIPPKNESPPKETKAKKANKEKIGKKGKIIDVKPEKEEDRDKKIFERFDKGEADPRND